MTVVHGMEEAAGGKSLELELVRTQGEIKLTSLKLENLTEKIDILATRLDERDRVGEAAITTARRDFATVHDRLEDRVFGDSEYSLDKRVARLEQFRWFLAGALAAGMALSGAAGALVSQVLR